MYCTHVYSYARRCRIVFNIESLFPIIVNNQTEFGLHGYDNEDAEMYPFFFANGPAFIPGCKLDPFNNTDLFPLFCQLLDLKCPTVNGTLSHVIKCLRTQYFVRYPPGMTVRFPSTIVSKYIYIRMYFNNFTYLLNFFIVMFVSVIASILSLLMAAALFALNVTCVRKRRLSFTSLAENENQQFLGK